jgi:universal stress protein A|tara:strand:+ start:614 stop:1153 length:540 start_codon:yes stop_codon:yes gene_type:complete
MRSFNGVTQVKKKSVELQSEPCKFRQTDQSKVVLNMADYTHILVAVDLTEESRIVATKACGLKSAYDANLSCVHVIEPLSLAYGGDIPMDLSMIQEQIHETAKSQLAEFASTLDVATENQHLIFGRPETEIDTLAQQISADLIVVGSHGRHGIALLLGSTANGVLHGAPCDVLAVRVGT